MPTPSTSLATLRPDLGASFEEFDLEMDRAGFVGLKVLPVFEAPEAGGVFGRIPLEALLQNRETVRGARGAYNRADWDFDDEPYSTKEQGIEEVVDDNLRKMYRHYFDAEVIAAKRARDAVLRNQEKRAAALVFNTTTWTGASLTTAAGVPWSTIATAVPVTDVEAAVRKVWDGTGIWPNALVLSRKKYRDVRRCAQVIDMMKSQGFHDVIPSKVTPALLAQVFDLDYVLVAGSAKNTANEAQAATIGSIWTDTQAMVCKIATTDDIGEPCIGRTFHWDEDGSEVGAAMETYRDETVRGDVVRARHQVGEKIIYKELGHLLTSL